MEKLEYLARVLHRVEPCSAIRGLRRDVLHCLALGHASTDEMAELLRRAVSLKVIREREAIL